MLQIKLKRIHPSPPPLFTLLGEPVRWRIIQTLALSDWTIRELAQQVKQPLNLLSYHLRLLREAHLIDQHRSRQDSRATYCSLNVARLAELYERAGVALHPSLRRRTVQVRQPFSVLFLCTHNAARSQMAEGLLREAVQGRWRVESAGSRPSGVHPLAIATLADRGIDIRHQTSKDLTVLSSVNFDVVISLCDFVRAEAFPFANRPWRMHWSLPDPLETPKRSQKRAFRETADRLAQRIGWFLSDPPAFSSSTVGGSS